MHLLRGDSYLYRAVSAVSSYVTRQRNAMQPLICYQEPHANATAGPSVESSVSTDANIGSTDSSILHAYIIARWTHFCISWLDRSKGADRTSRALQVMP